MNVKTVWQEMMHAGDPFWPTALLAKVKRDMKEEEKMSEQETVQEIVDWLKLVDRHHASRAVEEHFLDEKPERDTSIPAWGVRMRAQELKMQHRVDELVRLEKRILNIENRHKSILDKKLDARISDRMPYIEECVLGRVVDQIADRIKGR